MKCCPWYLQDFLWCLGLVHPLLAVAIYAPNWMLLWIHSRADSYKRTLKRRNEHLACSYEGQLVLQLCKNEEVEQDSLYSKADFQFSLPLALLLGHWKWDVEITIYQLHEKHFAQLQYSGCGQYCPRKWIKATWRSLDGQTTPHSKRANTVSHFSW